MAFAPGWRASSRFPARRGAARALAAAAVALSLSLCMNAVSWLPAAAPVGAQFVTTATPSVTVHGTGEASAPAETATVQLLIGQGGRQFGFSQDESSGSSFESAGAISPDDTTEAETAPEATPEAGEDDMAVETATSEGRRGRRGRPEPQPITEERLAPVVEAITTGTGIAPEAVTIDLSPLATEPFGGRRESARLDFEVAQPTPEALNDLIAAASDAATADGMVIEVAGVLYNPADCAVIEDEAALASIADARAQADRLAAQLEVTLGSVVGATSDPFFVGSIGPEEEESGCAGQQSSFYESQYGGLGITVPVFDPSAPAEVEVYAVLTISYEILESEPD